MSKQVILQEALRYIQVPYEVADDDLKEEVLGLYRYLRMNCQPKVIYNCYDIHKTDIGVAFQDTMLYVESQDMLNLLANCDRCIVMAATLGIQADKLISLKQRMNMSDAFILDACANVRIERVCDKAEQEIMEELEEAEFLTMRYSPGYGDVPLDVQEDLLRTLDASKAIGLNLTRGGSLLPSKSVTAFIGISNVKENRRKSCKNCMIQAECVYRKRGDVCGK